MTFCKVADVTNLAGHIAEKSHRRLFVATLCRRWGPNTRRCDQSAMWHLGDGAGHPVVDENICKMSCLRALLIESNYRGSKFIFLWWKSISLCFMLLSLCHKE